MSNVSMHAMQENTKRTHLECPETPLVSPAVQSPSCALHCALGWRSRSIIGRDNGSQRVVDFGLIDLPQPCNPGANNLTEGSPHHHCPWSCRKPALLGWWLHPSWILTFEFNSGAHTLRNLTMLRKIDSIRSAGYSKLDLNNSSDILATQ